MEKRREGIFAYTHTQYAHESRRHLQGSEEWTATALSHCTSLNLYTQIERYTNTHTERQRDRERESSFLVTSTSTHAYALLLLNFTEREREREREDSLFNAVPLSHILSLYYFTDSLPHYQIGYGSPDWEGGRYSWCRSVSLPLFKKKF